MIDGWQSDAASGETLFVNAHAHSVEIEDELKTPVLFQLRPRTLHPFGPPNVVVDQNGFWSSVVENRVRVIERWAILIVAVDESKVDRPGGFQGFVQGVFKKPSDIRDIVQTEA